MMKDLYDLRGIPKRVTCEMTFEDNIKPLFFGSTALIYQCTEDPDYILKYSVINTHSLIVPRLKQHCLFNECIIKMKECRVFNNDIKYDNIGLDDNKFVFIDLDFMIPYSCQLLSGTNVSLRFPKGLDKSLMLHNYKVTHKPELLLHYNDQDSAYNERTYNPKNKLLIDNFISETTHPGGELIYDYLCIYQLIETSLYYIKILNVQNIPPKVDSFIERCLDYNRYGFITSEECLEIYDQLLN